MKVILLKGIPKVGKPEEVVEVNEGFARNSLFPRKLAVPATRDAIEALKRKQSGRAEDKAMRKNLLEKAIEEVNSKKIIYKAPANKQGSLFSKITAKDITDFLMSEHRIDIDPSYMSVPGGGIKKTGEYLLDIKEGAYQATLNIQVVHE